MKNYVQEHLEKAGFIWAKVREDAVCADGTTLSIQASEGHYCWPRNNDGPYTEVEVWCVSSAKGRKICVPSMGEDHDNPYEYVDIAVVNKFIHRHGGLAED